MKLTKWNRPCVVVVGAALLAATTGCPFSSPPEAVLEGTWKLTTSQALNPPVTDWLLTFDKNGDLTEVKYTANAATVTWDRPRATTNVDGSDVSISGERSGGSLTFEGTLDSTNTVITGKLTSTLEVGSATITVDHGDATMTKQ